MKAAAITTRAAIPFSASGIGRRRRLGGGEVIAGSSAVVGSALGACADAVLGRSSVGFGVGAWLAEPESWAGTPALIGRSLAKLGTLHRGNWLAGQLVFIGTG